MTATASTVGLLEAALAATAAGIGVLPPKENGSKMPDAQEWTSRQQQRATRVELEGWYGPHTGIGWVCGKVSGNLETLEFDEAKVYYAFKEAARTAGLGDLVERIESGYLEQSPSGGFHWPYRCEEISGNTKLARRPKRPEEMRHSDDKVKALIETRGEGGYIIVAPSNGKVHPNGSAYRLLNGSPATIATITSEEREALFALARTFDQMPRESVEESRKPLLRRATEQQRLPDWEIRPGDDFNQRTEWASILEPHGWRFVRNKGEEDYWAKPGKQHRGWSATTANRGGSDLLYVFTTATQFDSERAYSKFAAYTVLNYQGDFTAAAAALAEQGYGKHVEATEESTSGLPRIICNGRQLRDITNDALTALVVANNPPLIFQRGKEMVRVVESAEKRPVIQPLHEAALRGELARAADWATRSQKGAIYFCPPPMDVVRDVNSVRSWPPEIPPLADIIEAPALRTNGSIILTPGYDQSTGVFYMPSSDLTVPSVPASPTRQAILDAVCTVEDVIGDFPFDGPASLAGAVALMLTPLVRPCLGNAPAPMALLDAPQQGNGKSLFARIVSIVATGQEAAAFTAPTDEAEWRKSITAIVRAGSPFVLIDNVDLMNWQGDPIPLRSAALSAILTTGVHRDRVLGASTMVDFPTRATWALSGNNVQVSGDLIRRCYRIRIDAKMAQPWMRTGFTHPDLIEYVRERRGEILAALLTLCRAWFDHGRPVAPTPVLGSFEAWSRIIGGILAVADISGFLCDQAALYASSDAETPEWEAFLTRWRSMFGDKWTAVTALDEEIRDTDSTLREALPAQLAEQINASAFKKRLGQALKKKLAVRHGEDGLYLDSRDEPHSKVKQWRVTSGG